MRHPLFLLLLLFLSSALAFGAAGQERRDRPHGAAPAPAWHGDIHHFHEHDWPIWRSGHWTHARHDGRAGWWWVVGSSWYFYPAPIYPAPNPYEPPLSPVPSAAPLPSYWYYCSASQSYYPYVQSCPGGWVQVPATPAPPAAEPQP